MTTAARTYTVKVLSISPRGSVKAQLLEDGSIIAEVRRQRFGHCLLGFEVTKYHSDRARDRFLSFCDSLSVGETLEALTELPRTVYKA